MPTSLWTKILTQGTAVSIGASVCAFFVWTKHCKFEDLDPAKDPIFRSTFYRKFNPSNNPTTHDVCVRRLPLWQIKGSLVADAENGGSALVEAFCQGLWGGLGYTPRRLYLSRKYQAQHPDQLYTRSALRASTYDVGTLVSDYFEVVSKTPTSIIFRCGDSPTTTEVRSSDGLFEIAAKADFEKGFAEFRLKSVFYQGLGKAEHAPMDAKTEWAHRQYAKLWMEDAVRNVRKSWSASVK